MIKFNSIKQGSLKKKNTYSNLVGFISLIVTMLILTNISFATKDNENEFLSKIKVENMMAEYNVAGCAITYIKNGKTVISNGYGNTNIFTKSKVSNESTFEAGSNGKILTAYICMKLEEQGKIDLDEPVVNYIGEEWIRNDEFSKKITVRNLLSHTSGFSNSYEVCINKKVYFESGTKYQYSGVGYIYLQKIIERITGKAFEEIAKEYVFEPLGMNNSSFSNNISNNRVSPHINSKSLVLYILVPFIVFFVITYLIGFVVRVVTKFEYYSKLALFKISIVCSCILGLIFSLVVLSKLVIPLLILYGVGGVIHVCIRKYNSEKLYYCTLIISILIIVVVAFAIPVCIPTGNDIINKGENPAYSLKTTNSDIGKFIEELLNVYNGDDKVLKNMFSEQVEIDKENSWGLGIGIEHVGNKTTYWHSGINPGYQSLIVINGEDNSGVAILTNSDNGLDFAKEIARCLMNINGKWDIKVS